MISNVSLLSFRRLPPGLVSLALLTGSAIAGQPLLNHPYTIEVFTSAEYPLVGIDVKKTGIESEGADMSVYEIDGIRSVEHLLSNDLPADPKQSKQIALHRIQHMDDQSKTKMQMAAQGLAKAMQYGVDRYPAIVFDGQVVVYGVTDVQTAITHYQTWRREGKR